MQYVKKRTTAEKQRHVCSEDRMNSDQGMLNNRVSVIESKNIFLNYLFHRSFVQQVCSYMR